MSLLSKLNPFKGKEAELLAVDEATKWSMKQELARAEWELQHAKARAEMEQRQQRAMFQSYAQASPYQLGLPPGAVAPMPAGVNPFGSLVPKTVHVEPDGLVQPELPEDTTAAELFKELTEHHRYGKVMKRVLAEIAASQEKPVYTEQEVRILESIKECMANQKGNVINIPIPSPLDAAYVGPDDPVPF